MVERIDGPTQTHQTISETAGPRGLSGQFRGEQVAQKTDLMSLIANASEELTFSISERVEKKLAQRKRGDRAGQKTTAMERAEAYLKKLPDIGKAEKLQQFLEHLKKKGVLNAKQLLEEAKDFFKDVSHQYAGLAFARETLEEDDKKHPLIGALKEAMDTAMAENGPQIRAGFNISETAETFSQKGIGETQSLRDLYRNKVLKYEGFHETYQSILDTYGSDKLPDAVSYLIKAVGMDMSSKGPSISSPELKLILDDLYQVEVLGNIHKECGGLLQKIENEFGTKPDISPSEMMKQIMNLKQERWLKPDDVLKLLQNAGIQDVEAQIYFLREVKNLIRDIPLKVYEESETRDKLLDAVQEALDMTIDKEDEELS